MDRAMRMRTLGINEVRGLHFDAMADPRIAPRELRIISRRAGGTKWSSKYLSKGLSRLSLGRVESGKAMAYY
jgi:hypothetical protein